MSIVPLQCQDTADFHPEFLYAWQIASHDFNKSAFRDTLRALIEYPERSSPVIMRADILQDSTTDTSGARFVPDETCWHAERKVVRKLLPRNPKLDKPMLQDCFCYVNLMDTDKEYLVIYEPQDSCAIPYYHPQVQALAFHYRSSMTRIAFVSLDPASQHDTQPITDRLSRTMYQLLSIVRKHSMGVMTHYIKRVQHDQLVEKNHWQDLYTYLKGQYANQFVSNWVEDTDPRKHVFEDLGIASFLINLTSQVKKNNGASAKAKFVDIGCGNGLLVELLNREGHEIYGFDVRRRKSWAIYEPSTQALLHEMVLYPSLLSMHPPVPEKSIPISSLPELDIKFHDGLFANDKFLIGNHADELTPYIPLLAALASVENQIIPGTGDVLTAGFIIIPCCTYTFSGHKHNGLSTKGGRYASYISWLIEICEAVGWVVEREALRIPSTRNHAIIGRRRTLVEDRVTLDYVAPLDLDNQHMRSRKARLLEICHSIITRNGGMVSFLDHALTLVSAKPRSH